VTSKQVAQLLLSVLTFAVLAMIAGELIRWLAE
jgi:hypothetical protein